MRFNETVVQAKFETLPLYVLAARERREDLCGHHRWEYSPEAQCWEPLLSDSLYCMYTVFLSLIRILYLSPIWYANHYSLSIKYSYHQYFIILYLSPIWYANH